jgi:hypothetical protein
MKKNRSWLRHVLVTFEKLYKECDGNQREKLFLFVYMTYNGLNNLKNVDIEKITCPEMLRDYKNLVKLRNHLLTLQTDVVAVRKASDLSYKEPQEIT